jgi:hypothetical protein
MRLKLEFVGVPWGCRGQGTQVKGERGKIARLLTGRRTQHQKNQGQRRVRPT